MFESFDSSRVFKTHDLYENEVMNIDYRTNSSQSQKSDGYWWRGRVWSFGKMLFSAVASPFKILYHSVAAVTVPLFKLITLHPEEALSSFKKHSFKVLDTLGKMVSGTVTGAIGIALPKTASKVDEFAKFHIQRAFGEEIDPDKIISYNKDFKERLHQNVLLTLSEGHGFDKEALIDLAFKKTLSPSNPYSVTDSELKLAKSLVGSGALDLISSEELHNWENKGIEARQAEDRLVAALTGNFVWKEQERPLTWEEFQTKIYDLAWENKVPAYSPENVLRKFFDSSIIFIETIQKKLTPEAYKTLGNSIFSFSIPSFESRMLSRTIDYIFEGNRTKDEILDYIKRECPDMPEGQRYNLFYASLWQMNIEKHKGRLDEEVYKLAKSINPDPNLAKLV